MKKNLKTVLRTVLIAVTALIVGLNVYSMNASRLAGVAVPMPFGVGAAVIVSGSMEPTLSVGDLIIVAEQEDYEVGDVVVFQDGHMAVTHRIMEIREVKEKTPDPETGELLTRWEVITKGDANNTEDEPFDKERIMGEVVFSIPLVGYLVNMIKTPVGTLVILATAVFLMERSFRADKKKDVEELDVIRAEIEKLKQQQGSQDSQDSQEN